MAHLPPDLVRDAVTLVHVEGYSFAKHEVHHGRVRESDDCLHD